jgi:hypothetical protein
MLSKHLDITYAMVWSIALANILGAGLCYLFSGQFARLATLRYTLILPCVLGIIYIGAFEGSRSWGDLFSLLAFGVLGWTMKQMRWPRPPLILGLVLGDTVERYLFISVERYGYDWLARPIVIGLLALAVYGLLRPLIEDVKHRGGFTRLVTGFGRPHFRAHNLFHVFMILVVGWMVIAAFDWPTNAKIVPVIVGSLALAFAIIGLLNEMFRPPEPEHSLADGTKAEIQQTIHMDLESDTGHLDTWVILRRAGIFFGWLIAFMASMAVIGLIPTVPIFVVGYMRLEGREPWRLVIPQAVGLTVFIYVVFDRLLNIPWPQTLLGMWFPALRAIIPSV